MDFSYDFIEKLKVRLKGELPGRAAHLQMNPLHFNPNFPKLNPDENSHKTAVLILLFPNESNKLCVLLTLRSDKLKNHSGEISFPGGHLEGDEDSIQAALRETFEEVGIPSQKITVIGELSPFFALPSDSYIQPVVGFAEHIDNLLLNPDEVQEAIIVPIEDLLNPVNLDHKIIQRNERIIQIPYWKVHSERPLWGATAMIMNELLSIITTMLHTDNLQSKQ